jgi:hypothetical protein
MHMLSRKKPSSITIEFSRGNYNKILSCLFSISDLEYLQIERCIMSLPREFEGFKQLTVLNLHTPNLSNVYVTLDKTKVADRSKNYMMQSFCQPNWNRNTCYEKMYGCVASNVFFFGWKAKAQLSLEKHKSTCMSHPNPAPPYNGTW